MRGLGLELQFSQIGDPQVLVGKVPMCFTEKESKELCNGRQSIIKPKVEVRSIPPLVSKIIVPFNISLI